LKLGPRKLIATAVLVVSSVLAFVAWQVAGLDGLVLVTLLVAVVGFIGVWYLVVQIERHATGREVAMDRKLIELRDQTLAVAGGMSSISEKLHEVEVELETIGQAHQAQEAKDEDLGPPAILDSRETNLYRQIEALMGLYKESGSVAGFPQNRTFMAAPDLLYFLFREARAKNLNAIVECGSGLSTLIIAFALRSKGNGRVVALEHLERYVEETRDLLAQHGLTDWAEIRFAPLEPTIVDGQTRWWYSVDSIPDGPIDLLLVDGPPGRTGREARFPALPLLIDRLAPSAQVIMDDYFRVDEKAIVDKWLAMFPELTLEVVGHEKGTAVLRFARKAAPTSS
jgi:predicted O-methyltransferase YrrM